ncbi:cobyrinate a,c-diamide synthase [Desulfobacula toluolica]|nr:cobyrinate a,c-diamide synthase [Desulfobacula toluolica]
MGATGSGTGKTTISLAILSYLADMGIKVAPFKVGPDFIDPGHHTKIAGKTSINLDSWMLSKEYNTRIFNENTAGYDVAVIEGVMGLFDGFDGLSDAGSTAQMAKWLDLPVVLIVSARGKARSAAAIVKGFETFDPELKIAGVIFTKTGSLRHYDYLKKAVEQSCKTKCLGFMPKNERIVMPERHLGLVTSEEMEISREVLSLLSDMVRDHIDMEGLIKSLESFETLADKQPKIAESSVEKGPAIAVARDKAFCFYYPDNLELLKKAGARIVEFSPLNDDRLPQNIDGIYFGGGYPEVFAEKLSEKTLLLKEIKEKSMSGMPIYGECGGFMFLCNKMSGMDETQPYFMSGCFNLNVQMSKRLRSLGYREITLTKDTIIGKKGDVLRGHEFHYSSLENPDSDTANVYHVTSRAGQDISLHGYQVSNTLGSYLHIHFGSSKGCAKQFVDCCKKFKDTKK